MTSVRFNVKQDVADLSDPTLYSNVQSGFNEDWPQLHNNNYNVYLTTSEDYDCPQDTKMIFEMYAYIVA